MSEVIKPTMLNYRTHVLVCIGNKCTSNGEGQALYNELKIKLRNAGLDTGDSRILRSKVGCLGTCKAGPLICVQPDGVWYYDISSAKLDRIIAEHLVGGQPVQEWVYHQGPGCSS